MYSYWLVTYEWWQIAPYRQTNLSAFECMAISKFEDTTTLENYSDIVLNPAIPHCYESQTVFCYVLEYIVWTCSMSTRSPAEGRRLLRQHDRRTIPSCNAQVNVIKTTSEKSLEHKWRVLLRYHCVKQAIRIVTALLYIKIMRQDQFEYNTTMHFSHSFIRLFTHSLALAHSLTHSLLLSFIY